MDPLPMFPLGSVLVPGMALPLHVFEPRYRRLVADCIEGSGEFGVVLIRRGSEVGGGDTRASVGTVAQVLEALPFDDGRWAISSIGTRRVRVAEWLDDDPYPRAVLEPWPDIAHDPFDGADEAMAEVAGDLRRVLALRAELGQPAAPATVELSDDPALGSYQAAVLCGLGPLDLYEVLCHDDRRERIGLVARLVREHLTVAEQQMQMDASDGEEPDR